MEIELNFEAGNGTTTEEARRVLYMLTLGPAAAQSRVVESSYNGPDGEVNVETIVAKVNVNGVVEALGLAYYLAIFLGQDCVALLTYDGTSGYLVGPNAAKWGAFNPEFFIRF